MSGVIKRKNHSLVAVKIDFGIFKGHPLKAIENVINQASKICKFLLCRNCC